MNVTRDLRNIGAVARREFIARGATRTFVISTVVLVLIVCGVALSPILVRYFGEEAGTDRIALVADEAPASLDVRGTLERLLNASAALAPGTAPGSGRQAYEVEAVSSADVARQGVEEGRYDAGLVLGRSASGDLAFTLYTKALPTSRLPQLLQQAAAAVVIGDRLERLGISPTQAAGLFAPPSFEVRRWDAETGWAAGPDEDDTAEAIVGASIAGTALAVFILLAIVLYGQWVAMSVVEEKTSRVLEVILGAATPFQLLAGKVVGVGGLGLLQYVVTVVPAALILVFQDQIAALVLGEGGGANLPTWLSPGILLAFGVMFVLAFGLYAVLYAAAGSLVSRQEDVNTVVAPLSLVSTLGYVISVWAASGVLDLRSPVVVVLTQVPFLAPYFVPSRLAFGTISPFEVVLAVVLLLVSIPIAIWFAARLYSAGILMYGQRPGLRMLLAALRGA
ncbi:MAG TPA: ABC transporter permease [Candidatus Binatia bacterium]|nr:ABC transporter permease [Candidatus Binatia bacterium]